MVLPRSTCARDGHVDFVRELLKRGSEVDKGFGAALSLAVRKRKVRMAKLLLKHGANPNRGRWVYSGVQFPHHQAVRGGHHELVALLLKHGADRHDISALQEAQRLGHRSVVQRLRDAGAQHLVRAD